MISGIAVLAVATAFLPTADAHWGGPAACGTPHIVEITTEYQEMAWPDTCTIGVNTRYTWTAQQLCVVVTHGAGHLRGLPHLANSVMDPTTYFHYPPKGCPPDEFEVRNRINNLRDALGWVQGRKHRRSLKLRLAKQRAVLAEVLSYG